MGETETTEAPPITVVIRMAELEDKNFILSTWLKGNYYANPYFGIIPQDLYFREYGKHVMEVLYSPRVTVRVACDQASPGWIVGFAVYEGHALHWIHVRRDYRGRGIAKLLLKDVPITETRGITRRGREILRNKDIIFNPFQPKENPR